MKKLIITIIAILLVATAVFITYKSVNSQKEEIGLKTIQLNEVTRSVFYAPQYVAISNGFFEQEGLKLDITTGQGAETPLTRWQQFLKIHKSTNSEL